MAADRPQLNRLEVLRTLKVSNWEAVAATVHFTVTNGAFQIGFALMLKATDVQMGVLTAVPTLAGLFQIASSYLIERRGERKWFCAWLSLAGRFLWLPILLIPWLLADPRYAALRLPLFLALYMGASALVTITLPAWMSWMSDLVPPDHRGRYFGQRSMIAGITATVVALPAGWFLDLAQKAHRFPEPVAYAVLFGIACLAGLWSFLCLLRQSDPPMRRMEAPQQGGVRGVLPLYLAPLRDTNFRRYLLFGALFAASQFFAAPFFLKYQIEYLKFSYTTINFYVVEASLLGLASMPLWGYLSDKFGHKPTIVIGVAGVATLPAIWIMASPAHPNMARVLVFLLNVLGGAAWSAVGLGMFNLLMSSSPAERKTFYVGAWSAVTGLAGGISPIIGGTLMSALGSHPTVFGWHTLNYHVVFGINTAMRFIALLSLGPIVERQASSARAVLAQLGGTSVGAWMQMRRLQRGQTEETRKQAAQALRTARATLAVDELIAALGDPSLHVREEAAVALGEIGDPRATDALVVCLTEPGSGIVPDAATALGRIGDERAAGPLGKLLHTGERAERIAAAHALGRIGGPRSLSALRDVLELGDAAGDTEVLEACIEAIGQTGEHPDAEAIACHLAHSVGSVRLAAVRALGRLGDASVVPALLRSLAHEDNPALLSHVAVALGALGDVAAIGPLLESLDRVQSPVARRQVLHAVGALLGQNETFYPMLAMEGFARDEAVSRLLREMARKEKSTVRDDFGHRRRARLLDRVLEDYLAGSFSAAAQTLSRLAPDRKEPATRPYARAVEWARVTADRRALEAEEFLLALFAVRCMLGEP